MELFLYKVCLLLLNVPVNSCDYVGTVTSDFVGLLHDIEMQLSTIPVNS